MKHHGRFVSPRDRYQPRCTGVLQPAATMGVFRTVEGIKFSKHSPIPVRSILTADDMENRSWSQFSRKWRRRSFYHGNQWNMIFDTREIIYGSTSRSWPSTTFFFFLFFFFFFSFFWSWTGNDVHSKDYIGIRKSTKFSRITEFLNLQWSCQEKGHKR